MTLGSALKQHRESAGITQEQVAKTLYVTRQTVSRWEQNKTMPNINVLQKLSELYHVPLAQLVVQNQPDTKDGKAVKHINYLSLIGAITFNVIIGLSVWIAILGMLLALWAIAVLFILAPLIYLGGVGVGLQAFATSILILSLVLCAVGVFLFPAAKKVTKMVLNFGKKYLAYNQKSVMTH
ncbi:helix-turn-helix domain-containing protein [Lapidilactobacillus bayanensis]|uniref:helix-turn-helix domain-containing protein n=1 Tax=Lapidilactobacillus bayanensis TaxID=2485998 RepID=UPI000F770FFD|nr:helix-turn-helix domain-containing protein [Lapidilactobacillus bayanensis]